jgi:hypothetical protein
MTSTEREEVLDAYEMVKTLVGGLTYKPGWYFLTSLSDNEAWPMIDVEITARLQDVTKRKVAPPQIIILETRVVFSPDELKLTEAKNWILRSLHAAIVQMEHHEIDEWFRLDGEPVTNPHPKNSNTTA